MVFFLVMLIIGVGGSGGAFVLSRKFAARSNDAAGRATAKQKRQTPTLDARRLPYRYADDLIFISGSSVWTGVKLSSTTDEYLTDAEREEAAKAVAETYNALLAVFDGQPVHCHEQIRYRPSSAEQWERSYQRELWNPSQLFKRLIQQVSALLEESTPERERFLIVRLGDFHAESFPDPLTQIAETITAVADEHFKRSDLDPFRDKAAQVHLQLATFDATPMTRTDLIWLIRKVMSGHRFPAEQPILMSKPVRNSFFDLIGDFHGRNGHNCIEILDTDPETGQSRSSFTSTMVVAHAAPQIEFNPAYAWGPRLAQLAQPVELSWRYELIPAELFKKRAKKVADNIKNEETDRAKAGAEYDPFFESKVDRANELIEEIGLQPQPAMIGKLRLVLSAPTPGELAAAETEVRAALGSDIEVIAVPHAQAPLLIEQLPGDYVGKVFGGLVAAKGGGVAIGERITDTWAPAVARLDSADRVGDRVEMHKGRRRGTRGFPIGWSYTSGAPTHYSLHAQVRRDRGAGVAIIGASGGGKSTLALLLYFWESESGTQTMVLDPKNDFEKFTYYLAFGEQVMHPGFMNEARAGTLGTPQSQFQPVNRPFWADTTIINLTQGSPGQLDAWSVHDNYAEAEELARGQLEVLFQNTDDREVVEHGLRRMRAQWEQQQAGTLPPGQKPLAPSLGAVVEFIKEQRQVYAELAERNQDVASTKEIDRHDRVIDRFTRAQSTQYARLLVGDGERIQLGDMSRRRVIFTLHGFNPPASQETKDWSEAECNAAACMFTALTIVQGVFDDSLKPHPVTGKLGVPPRALFVDEGYMIARMKKGQLMLSRGLRMGRSLNLVVVFISQQERDIQELEQQARDAGEADVNQFGTVFVFRQKSPAEAGKALRLLRDTTNDSSTEIASLARNLLEEGPAGGLLRGGRCAMRDVDGRVATVSIDQMFHELARATETNATERPVVQAVPISADGWDWELDATTMFEVRRGILDGQDTAHVRGDEVEFDESWLEFIAAQDELA